MYIAVILVKNDNKNRSDMSFVYIHRKIEETIKFILLWGPEVHKGQPYYSSINVLVSGIFLSRIT